MKTVLDFVFDEIWWKCYVIKKMPFSGQKFYLILCSICENKTMPCNTKQNEYKFIKIPLITWIFTYLLLCAFHLFHLLVFYWNMLLQILDKIPIFNILQPNTFFNLYCGVNNHFPINTINRCILEIMVASKIG